MGPYGLKLKAVVVVRVPSYSDALGLFFLLPSLGLTSTSFYFHFLRFTTVCLLVLFLLSLLCAFFFSLVSYF